MARTIKMNSDEKNFKSSIGCSKERLESVDNYVENFINFLNKNLRKNN